MSIKYNIGGSATLNGVIFINTSLGKVARAVRGKYGVISVKELPTSRKAMRLYKNYIEKPLSKIPAIRELFMMLLMFVIIISSLFTGIIEMFSTRERWTLKRIATVVLFFAGIYVLLFLDDYLSLIFLIIAIVCFNRQIVVMLRYHGAEHKCINMYENISDMSDATIENARAFPRTHLRCGTNIIIILIPLSLIYYFVLERYMVSMIAGGALDLLGRLVLLGIGIEIFKLFQKPLTRWILKPGIWAQRFITTKEPDDNQLEVALMALKAVLDGT